MGQSVNDALLGVELVGDAIEILSIPALISPEHSVGDMVGKLDDAGRPRIHEQRRVRQVPDDSPASPERPKLDRHLLKRRFVGALVEYHEPPLCVTVGPQTLQVAPIDAPLSASVASYNLQGQ